jgi:hypothetical protein
MPPLVTLSAATEPVPVNATADEGRAFIAPVLRMMPAVFVRPPFRVPALVALPPFVTSPETSSAREVGERPGIGNRSGPGTGIAEHTADTVEAVANPGRAGLVGHGIDVAEEIAGQVPPEWLVTHATVMPSAL